MSTRFEIKAFGDEFVLTKLERFNIKLCGIEIGVIYWKCISIELICYLDYCCYTYSGNKRVKAEKFSYESMRRQLFSNKRFFFYTTTHVSVSFVFVDGGGGVNINIVIVIDVTVDIGCNLQLAPNLHKELINHLARTSEVLAFD